MSSDNHINPNLKPRIRKQYSKQEFIEGIQAKDRVILSQAITLIESNRLDHQVLAREIIKDCLPLSGNSIRIGITGVPGVGKSTFIESSGLYLIDNFDYKLAVLAIDPSSSKQGGSILGDKTRMQNLSVNDKAFIRPSPTAGSLGGVARKTREAIILCEAAGYNLIFVETVGVGQSETAVYDMVDCFLLLMLAGAGDQLQGIKRGIMEMADIIAITKADGENQLAARQAAQEYAAALHLFPAAEHKQITSVLTCSAISGAGIERLWQAVLSFCDKIAKSGYLSKQRQLQAKHWMHQSIEEQLQSSFYHHPVVQDRLPAMAHEVLENKRSPFEAAAQLMEIYRSNT